jgi:type II secretory pathway pseudopilin PulG
MAIDTTAADAAALAAQEALRMARDAQDAAEVEWLGTVTRVKQITENRTAHDANRLKSRYIAAFGFERWQTLVANSR